VPAFYNRSVENTLAGFFNTKSHTPPCQTHDDRAQVVGSLLGKAVSFHRR